MITAELTGERKVGLIFDEFPTRAHDALLARVTALTHQLESKVAALVPIGATGELLSLLQTFIDATPDRIAGKVKIIAKSKTDHGKAAALEYGAHQSTRVKAHTAQINQVFGRAIAPTTVFIAAYSRTPNIAEHAFMRGPLAEMQGIVLEQLQAALAEASAEAVS